MIRKADKPQRTTLDTFLLAILREAGSQTLYSLLADASVAPGASLPSVRRLLADGLIRQQEPRGERPSKAFSITAKGERALEDGWRDLRLDYPRDAESVLRRAWVIFLVDRHEAASYLRAASRQLRRTLRREERNAIRASQRDAPERVRLFQQFQNRLATAKLRTELKILADVADQLETGVTANNSNQGRSEINN